MRIGPAGFSSNFCQMVNIGLENIALQHQMCELALAENSNQAGRFQLFDVMRKCGCCDGLATAHIRAGHSFIPCANLLQDFMAARIGQSFGNQANLNG